MKTSLLCILLVISSLINAQTQHTGWLASFNTFKTGKNTSIHNDIQLRSSDELTHIQSFLARVGLNVKLSKLFTATAGYAFIHNRRVVSGVSGYAPEHRIWEQLLLNHKIHHTHFTHRMRLEQRFISRSTVQNNELQNGNAFFASRIRYFVRMLQPFTSAPQFKKGPFVALQNEVFANIGNTRNLNGKTFDQNRLYLAAGYRVNSSLDLETGYINQYVKNRSGRVNNHVVQVAAYLKL